MVEGSNGLASGLVNDSTDMRPIDIQAKEKVELFLQDRCGCTLNDGKPCSLRYSYDHISSIRDQCSSFQRSELNKILLGHVMATVRTSSTTIKVRRQSTDRSRNTTTFLHEGEKVRHQEQNQYKFKYTNIKFSITFILSLLS